MVIVLKSVRLIRLKYNYRRDDICTVKIQSQLQALGIL